MFTVRMAPNRHDIELFYNGRPVQCDYASIRYEGKLRRLVIEVDTFKLLPDSECPERNRFERILQAFGDAARMAALQPTCTLVQVNCRACDGCPQRPI